jgi:Icc-related predicted phosphoesterase
MMPPRERVEPGPDALSSAANVMKLLFATDLHGSESHYTRLHSAAGAEKPDLIILGGDLLPDDSALEPDRMGRGQPAFVRDQFRQIVQGLRDASKCREILLIFGNHDWTSSVTAMAELEADKLLVVLDLKKWYEADGLTFVGYSSTPPTPWFVKDFERLDMPGDVPPLLGGARWNPSFSHPNTLSATMLFADKPTMQDELRALVPPPAPWVFVAHAPPHASKVDRYHGNKAWGSRAVRESIEKHQPMLSLHGHIHESPSVTGTIRDQLGSTLAINPGQTRGKLCYATIVIDPAARKVLDVQHGHMA